MLIPGQQGDFRPLVQMTSNIDKKPVQSELRSFIADGNGSATFSLISAFSYCTFYNPGTYVLELYGNNGKIISIPQNTYLTIPVNFYKPDDYINYSIVWAGTGKSNIDLLFTVENLGISINMTAASGSSTVVIAGDTVGLAKQAQFPPALTPAGNLAVELPTITTANPLPVVQTPLPGTTGTYIGSNTATSLQNNYLLVRMHTSGSGGSGTSTTASTTSFAVANTTNSCNKMFIKAPTSNTDVINIGWSTASVNFPLSPGNQVDFNFGGVPPTFYFNSPNGTSQSVSWIAF